MGYPKQVYDMAWEEIGRRRRTAEEAALRRREESRKNIPELEQIERDMIACAMSVARTIVQSPEQAEALTLQLGQRNLALQQRRRALLEKNGFPPDTLEPRYTCPLCGDTGYQGTSMCSCMRTLLGQLASAQLGAVSPIEKCGFTNFDLTYYPDTPDSSGTAPRARMQEVLRACVEYAEHFSPSSESLLFLGRTGLGKTHLSLAIASAATAAGHGVVYTPTQRLIDMLESEKFARNAETREQYSESTRAVIETDLLVLDDLGTEFSTQFSISLLYNIINSRLVEGRPTIISTNLELGEIEERYSQRMVSRLVCSYQVFRFYGKDIRYIKKAKTLG